MKNSKSGKMTKMIKKVKIATSLSKTRSQSFEEAQTLEESETLSETNEGCQQETKNNGNNISLMASTIWSSLLRSVSHWSSDSSSINAERFIPEIQG